MIGKLRRVLLPCLEIACAAALLGAPARAQEEPAIPPAPPPGGRYPTSENPFATNRLPPADAQQLVQRAMSMDYQRTASSFYRVMEERRQNVRPGPADSFHSAVILGDWARAGRLMSRLPPDDAKKVYSKMLAGLARQAKAQQGFFKRYESALPQLEVPAEAPGEAVVTYAYRSGGDTLSGVFLSDDFFGVIEAAPRPLSDEDLASLGTLGKVALAGEAGQRALTERLKAGIKGFRDSDPAECMNAAKLLCSLGWPHLAEPYLPATAREVKESSPQDALLAADYFAARGTAERDAKMQQRAWGLLCAAAAKGAPDAAIVDRVIAQVAALESDFVRSALPALLTNSPSLAPPLLARVAKIAGTSPERAGGSEDRYDEFARALRVQALLVEGLAAAGDEVRVSPEFFSGLVWNWLNAAEQARAAAEAEMSQRAREAMYGQRTVYRNPRNSFTPEEALAAAPGENVIASLGAGLARQVRLMKFALQLLAFDDRRAFDYLKVCSRAYPDESRELCGNYLAAWVDRRSSALAKEDPEVARMRAQNPYYAQQQLQRPAGIPLTRARQNRNIGDLKALLAELRRLSPQLDPARVTWSFISIHSDAEVFRMEDIEAVFGRPERMERGEVRTIGGAMRVNLARRWRDLETQAKAGTNRSEQDMKDEVSRGYQVALELVKRGLGLEGGSWEDCVLRGQLFFDASEFERERGIKLADYVNLRDAAFASYRQAALLYGDRVKALPRGQWSITPYQSWFFVLLGASDLAALTPRQARDDLGFKAVHDAIAALPAAAAEAHLGLFAASLTNLLDKVPGQMRQKFLAAGVRVAGETNPATAPAREILDYYANLTDEAQLRVSVDGPTRVGHGRPFGVFVTLEHTRQLAREGGGFAKYLQNQAAQMSAMYGGFVPPGQRAAVDYRDNFQTNFHAALGAQFDVQSLTFADPSSKPMDIAREGWQAMPLAYAVLRARDPAVDRIPSIQIDMDFADQKGSVVLPVLSQVVPINAADDRTAARPCEGLAMTMTFDGREWRSAGKLTLEISAAAGGIIPPFQELFSDAGGGFEAETKDGGLTVSSVQSEKGTIKVQALRTWQIAYLKRKSAETPSSFRFPRLASGIPPAKIDYKRYVDADLESIDAKTATAGLALPGPSPALRYGLWVLGLALAMLLFMLFMRRWGRPVTNRATAPGLPGEFTPFSVVAFLRRLSLEGGTKLDAGDRAALQAEIRNIESAFFSAAGSPSGMDLRSIAQRWLSKAG